MEKKRENGKSKILFKEECYAIQGAVFVNFGHYPKATIERIVL